MRHQVAPTREECGDVVYTLLVEPYSAPNKTEITAIRPITSIDPDATAKDEIPGMMTAGAQTASAEARMYFQTAAMTEAIRRRLGLSAYQSARIVRTEKNDP